jgi:methionyl aminopeptidase
MTRKKRRRRDEQQRGGVPMLQAHEIEKMRAAGQLAAELLDMVGREIRPGMSTLDIDRMVDEMTRARGALSAPYRYRGFPGHCCTSVNDVVCHGIPDARRILREGDIINVDVTPILDGFHGDSSRTFVIGAVSPAAQRLVQDTYRALWKGISAVRPGGTTGDIGHAIQSFVEPRGYSVVRQFSGHGIGRLFHTVPAILHYGRPGTGEPLTPGMTFTIEPMINLGDWRCHILKEDGWTAVTIDGSLSAQFEHTVLVTPSGVEVLTLGAGEALQIEPPPADQQGILLAAGSSANWF